MGEVFDEGTAFAVFGAGVAEDEVAQDLHEFIDDQDAARYCFGSDAQNAVDAETDSSGIAVSRAISPLYLVQIVFEV